jgi:tripartite-type tricarboxylate transporter receptor subunit TctC
MTGVRVYSFVAVATALLCPGLMVARHAAAQKYPEKNVRLVVPFTPGGGADIFARLLAQRFSEVYAQQFIVDNRPGAGSTVGTEFVARSAPDGYTFLVTSASFAFSPGLYPKLRFDAVKDFAAVSQIVSAPYVLCVLPTLPVKDLQGFVRLAREQPGSVFYASSGPGSAMHLAGALFAVVTKTQLGHVPYKGGSQAAVAVMSGETTSAFNTSETVMALLRSKRLRALAVSTRERAVALPDVPTAIEAGVREFEAAGWFGVFAPANTPSAVVEQISGEVAKTMAMPVIRDRTVQDGAKPMGSTPAQFDRFVRDEIAKWTRIIRDAGIRLE